MLGDGDQTCPALCKQNTITLLMGSSANLVIVVLNFRTPDITIDWDGTREVGPHES